ncbi:MAG: sulfite exporter TauE/SafE family protein [Chitinophagaceae bacterium]
MVEVLFGVLFLGFTHTFEADHLVAVSSIVTSRTKFKHSLRDGIYWGLGHTSTILMVGLLILVLKIIIKESVFQYLESFVGVMLIMLGVWRLTKLLKKKQSHQHTNKDKNIGLAYGVGLVHGLAGSGAVVVGAITMSSISWGVSYLLVFGLGSLLGMMLATSILSILFTKKYINSNYIQIILTWISALLCIGLGIYVMYENLFAIN